MTEYYIADGKYGELEREYVEAPEKEVEIGDYVLFTQHGTLREVIGEYGSRYSVKRPGKEAPAGDTSIAKIYSIKLTPTQPEVVRYEGERYELAERKAEVGELVVVTKGDGWYEDEIGNVFEVIDGHEYGFDEETSFEDQVYVEHSDNKYGEINVLEDGHYLVLVPLKGSEGNASKATEATEGQTLELLANLARRVTELERENKQLRQDYEDSDKQTEKWAEAANRQLRNLQRNLETFAQEAANANTLAKSTEAELGNLRESTFTWAGRVEGSIRKLEEGQKAQPKAPKETDLMTELRQLLDGFERRDTKEDE